MNRLPAMAARAPILFYRWVISPWLPAACRFSPSCSTYALEAIDRFGALSGGGLALRRLCRCHPWGGMGYDPVPNALGDASAGNAQPLFSDTPRF